MKNVINPDALKTLREKQGWTQAQLAENIDCTKEQVSRWERGRSKRVRTYLREKLEKAFNVKWEVLTHSPTEDSDDVLDDIYPKTQLNVRVPASARNALILICKRYNVPPGDVIGLAPLLFLVTAEKSLRHRKDALHRIENLRSEIDLKVENLLPHLVPGLTTHFIDDETYWDEDKAVENLDVFNRSGYSYDVNDDCPYTNYLKIFAGDLLSDENLINEISSRNPRIPEYKIALDTLKELTGLEKGNERDDPLIENIQRGEIDLKEVMRQRSELNPEDYAVWLDKEQSRAKDAQVRRLRELLGFDDLKTSTEDLPSKEVDQ